jgi:hypothetical protein
MCSSRSACRTELLPALFTPVRTVRGARLRLNEVKRLKFRNNKWSIIAWLNRVSRRPRESDTRLYERHPSKL